MQRNHEPQLSLSVRLPVDLMDQLNNLAKATGRSRAYLTEEALKRYVEDEAWQVQAITEAIEHADSENATFASHEDVKEWLSSWGKDDDKALPSCT